MDNEFYTLLTDRGMAKIASALADKKQIHLQKMAVGDGGGQYYEPTASQTNLRHEVWRGEMNTLTVAPNNPNWLIAELVLPEEVGGWYVREVGVFDDEGELIAIGKFPESYKPLLPGGCGKQVCIRLIMEVSNTTAVTLTVDPSIVLATRDYVDVRLDEHEHSTNHPDATLTQKGFTQLSNATDSDDETKAATPKAVKAAMAEARNQTHTWNQITGVPDGTLTQKGIVKLNSATDSTSTTEAATPSAVKAAMDKANAAAPASHTHAWNQITGVPDGTLTQKGIVKLNSATDSTSTTEAATPSAVKAAMDKASAAAPTSHIHAWGQITGVPDGTLTQKGIVKLNNATDSTSTTEAATPSAVKAAMDKANAAAPASHIHAWGQITGVPDGTLTQKGIVKLNNATDSTSTTEAATPSAVKAAYDKASTAAPVNHTHYQFFTANGTFTAPDGVTQVFVEMLGGGGGGGGGAITNGGIAGASSGSGGTCGSTNISIVPVTPGGKYAVIVGAGGVGGAAASYSSTAQSGKSVVLIGKPGFPGTDGGDSTFVNVTAKGGPGGAGGVTSTASVINPAPSGNGAAGENSSYGTGGSGGSNTDGGNASGYGAGGGGGASGKTTVTTTGSTYTSSGSGFPGGKGSNGFVKISW
ncbi:phage tail protein [Salmonella enterica subsp. enterica serovar Brancaster]|uniref:Phage tail protein n=6 Tax=Salmonella TaxID=590 RepID=A0A722S4Y7_SALER|nr:tail fiber protein [Salmonella enterica]EAY2656472.1 phage tail protein [Salmonella enterica subsp. enterica serovar Typhimurium]EBG3536690.1 phage tail protein [Salmonella enterica subsp. enterica]ECG1410129.1 phage tail protein [Salmonella enterica subsp. enterica serovar Derby str. CFSAN000566]EJN2871828.1 tail fiber protein [Salmonella enterica subsp. enterica serovar Techimani]QUZ50006.1 tail fiber protein [Salmonella enterica subsp. enterica serovar Derby str. CFSAN000565]